MTTKTNETLRVRLQETTEAQDEAEYFALLAKVLGDFPNSIVLFDSPYPIQRYTCFMHVFEFTEKPEYIAIASRGFAAVLAGPKFGQWLLEKELLTELSENELQPGDLAFYFDEQHRITHAGLVREPGRVESKWGKGALFLHSLFDVPASYGTKIRFFRKLPYEKALEHFRHYAKGKGMLFVD